MEDKKLNQEKVDKLIDTNDLQKEQNEDLKDRPINYESKNDKSITKESKNDKSITKESNNELIKKSDKLTDKKIEKDKLIDKKSKKLIDKESKNELTDDELLEFYKKKCEKLKSEINKYKDQCSQKETENYELTTKISELREIVDDSVSIKTNLENMGINVDELLDEIDDD